MKEIRTEVLNNNKKPLKELAYKHAEAKLINTSNNLLHSVLIDIDTTKNWYYLTVPPREQ